MASLSALAAAIRERLLAEEPAPLPGFGTLRRVHMPARVETQSDGSKSLQPPRESLRLILGANDDSDQMALALARHLGLPVAQGRPALKQHVDQLEALLSARGDVPLEGVGIVRRSDRGILFGADPGLLATINASFEGLTTVGSSSEASGVAAETVEPVAQTPIPREALPLEAEALEEETIEIASEPVEDESPVEIEHETEGNPENVSIRPSKPAEVSSTEIGESVTTDGRASEADSGEVSATEADMADTLEPETAPSPEALPVAAALPFEIEVGPLGDEPYMFETPEASGETTVQPATASPGAEDSSNDIVNSADLDDPRFSMMTDETANPETAPEEAPVDVPPISTDLSFADTPAPAEDTDSAVDELLAGIWAGGTPLAADLLGTSAPPPDAPLDTESSPQDAQGAEDAPLDPEGEDAEAAPIETWFMTDIGPLPDSDAPSTTADTPLAQAPPPPVPRVPSPSLDWSTEAAASVAAGTAKRLEHVQTAASDSEWTAYEEPPEYSLPDPGKSSLLPWVLLGLIVTLAVVAFFMWPREETPVDRPATAQIEPTPLAPEASALDDSLFSEEFMSDAELDSLTAALNASSQDEVGALPPASVDPPAPERTPAPEAPREAPRATPSTPSPRGGAQAPNTEGLPNRLAAGLSGTEAIQLGARAYTWVVTSVSTLAEADRLAARYRQAGFRSRVIESAVDGRTMYRVAIGQFDTQANALLVRDRLPADIRGRDDIWTLNLADL